MATRKLKKVSDTLEPANIPSGGWPKITQGSHLTVKTFEDGHTELVWDDEALLSEVRNAILKAESTMPVTKEMKPAVKAKVSTRKKKEKDNA